MNRQLTDTGIMNRHAVEFLRSVYPRTYPVNGTVVSWARKCWGLQEQFKKKDRTDHTHHAIDAIVIASLNRKRFQEICSIFRDDGDEAYQYRKEALLAQTTPFPDFACRVYHAIENICVKYLTKHQEFKRTKRTGTVLPHAHKLSDGTLLRKVPSAGDTVRGQLHKETFYGLITVPRKQERKFVIRKYIDDITTFKSPEDFTKKIVDTTVGTTVKEQVIAYMDQGLSFKEAVSSPLWMKRPDEDGKNGVPIQKVRIYAEGVTDPHCLRRQLTPSKTKYKNHYYVKSTDGSNFRMALYLKEKKSKGKKKEYWDPEVDNILSHAKNLKNPEYVSLEERSDGKFLGFIYQGCGVFKYENTPEELKKLSSSDLQKRLYYLVKFKKDGRATLRYHRESRDDKSLGEFIELRNKTEGRNNSKTGDSFFRFDEHQELLLISPSNFKNHLLFEGIHFRISLDGEITFLI